MARIRPQLDPPLRARLQYADNSPTGARIVEDKALMARTFTYLFAGGATLALLTLLLPGSPDRSPLEFVGVGAAVHLRIDQFDG